MIAIVLVKNNSAHMYALTKNEEIRGHRRLSQRGNHGVRGLLPSPEMGRGYVSLILCFVTISGWATLSHYININHIYLIQNC